MSSGQIRPSTSCRLLCSIWPALSSIRKSAAAFGWSSRPPLTWRFIVQSSLGWRWCSHWWPQSPSRAWVSSWLSNSSAWWCDHHLSQWLSWSASIPISTATAHNWWQPGCKVFDHFIATSAGTGSGAPQHLVESIGWCSIRIWYRSPPGSCRKESRLLLWPWMCACWRARSSQLHWTAAVTRGTTWN